MNLKVSTIKLNPSDFFLQQYTCMYMFIYVIMLFPPPFLTPPISFQFFLHLSFLIYSDIHCSRFLLQEPSQFCRCCLFNRFIISLAHSVFVLFVSSSSTLPVGHVPALPKKKLVRQIESAGASGGTGGLLIIILERKRKGKLRFGGYVVLCYSNRLFA